MDSLIDFFVTAGKLKTTARFGWTKYKIVPESVADHSWRTAVISLVLAKRLGVDENKAVKMALVHDLAEAVTGDIERGKMPKAEKRRLETRALKGILATLDKSAAKEISDLCTEYRQAKSGLARLVHDADNLDMALQALEYEKARKIKLEEFFANRLHFTETRALAKEIKARR